MKIIIGVAIFTIIYVLGMDIANKYINRIDFNSPTSHIVEKTQNEVVEDKLVVSIRGEVIKPGTYELDNGSKLSDLIAKANGLGPLFDESSFNNEIYLINGKDYYIGKLNLDDNDVSLKISINSADEKLLMRLPSIGEVISSKIIEYRETNGEFTYLEQIKEVKGIGNSIFEKIKDLICL